MKRLIVGDPHAKVSNLDEMQRLIDFVILTAKEQKVDRIEILGDLFHTHAVLRLEVIDFWSRNLLSLPSICETIVLVGNHDMIGDYNSQLSALDVFTKMDYEDLHIIDRKSVV